MAGTPLAESEPTPADSGLPRSAPGSLSARKRGVSFVVPGLNEEKNIADTVAELRKVAPTLDDFEIVLVDDGSTDRTGAIMDELAAADPVHVKAVHNPRNLGLGGAYKVGAARASMPYVMMIPGDNNHPADGIIPITNRAGEADMILPYVSNPEVRTPMRRFISRCFTELLNTLFGLKVPYYNGLVIHRTDLLRTISIDTNGYAYQAEAVVKLLRRGATSVAVPAPLASHGDLNSRAFRVKNVLRVGRTIWRLMLSR